MIRIRAEVALRLALARERSDPTTGRPGNSSAGWTSACFSSHEWTDSVPSSCACACSLCRSSSPAPSAARPATAAPAGAPAASPAAARSGAKSNRVGLTFFFAFAFFFFAGSRLTRFRIHRRRRTKLKLSFRPEPAGAGQLCSETKVIFPYAHPSASVLRFTMPDRSICQFSSSHAHPRGRVGATRSKTIALGPFGWKLRSLHLPHESVGRKCPGQVDPQPRNGWNRSFSKISSTTRSSPLPRTAGMEGPWLRYCMTMARCSLSCTFDTASACSAGDIPARLATAAAFIAASAAAGMRASRLGDRDTGLPASDAAASWPPIEDAESSLSFRSCFELGDSVHSVARAARSASSSSALACSCLPAFQNSRRASLLPGMKVNAAMHR